MADEKKEINKFKERFHKIMESKPREVMRDYKLTFESTHFDKLTEISKQLTQLLHDVSIFQKKEQLLLSSFEKRLLLELEFIEKFILTEEREPSGQFTTVVRKLDALLSVLDVKEAYNKYKKDNPDPKYFREKEALINTPTPTAVKIRILNRKKEKSDKILRNKVDIDKNQSIALGVPPKEIIDDLHDDHQMILDFTEEDVVEHHARRADLFFYILVAYYRTNFVPVTGNTEYQQGEAKSSFEAAHSSFFPQLIDASIYSGEEFSWGDDKRIKKYHKKSILCGTHLMNSINATVSLSKMVNSFDSELEGGSGSTGETPSALRDKCLKIIQQVALGKKNPIVGFEEYLNLMDTEISDTLRGQASLKIGKKSTSFISRDTKTSPKHIKFSIVNLAKKGLKGKLNSGQINSEYIELLLMLSEKEKRESKNNPQLRNDIYLMKIYEIQKSILTSNNLNNFELDLREYTQRLFELIAKNDFYAINNLFSSLSDKNLRMKLASGLYKTLEYSPIFSAVRNALLFFKSNNKKQMDDALNIIKLLLYCGADKNEIYFIKYMKILNDKGCVDTELWNLVLNDKLVKREQTLKIVDIEGDYDWYTDKNMEILLSKLFGSNHNVVFFTPVDILQDLGTALVQNLRQQLDTALDANIATPQHMLIPLNLGNYHWAALYFHFSDPDLLHPTVSYIDPKGNNMPDEISNAITSVYGIPKDKVVQPKIKMQKDDYNCGAWVVTIFEHLVNNKGRLPASSFDIGEKRKFLANMLNLNNDSKGKQKEERKIETSDLLITPVKPIIQPGVAATVSTTSVSSSTGLSRSILARDIFDEETVLRQLASFSLESGNNENANPSENTSELKKPRKNKSNLRLK